MASHTVRDDESTLNWSVSEISGTNEHHIMHSGVSSSRTSGLTTPDRDSSSHIQQMDHLLATMQNLVSRESQGSTLEPSFKPLEAEETEDDIEETVARTPPRSQSQHQPLNLNTTPPVRDPGLSTTSSTTAPTSSKKLDQMRLLLRELETAHRKFTVSKIPRRSLNFGATTNFRPQSGSDSQAPSSESVSTTVIEAQRGPTSLDCQNANAHATQDLENKMKALEQEKEELANVVANLQSTVSSKENEILQLSSKLEEKHFELCGVQVKTENLIKEWKLEQDKRLEELKQVKDENLRLKLEMASAKQQVSVCETELEKALVLAGEFRKKMEETEATHSKTVQDFLSERSQHVKKINHASKELEKAFSERTRFEHQLKAIQSKVVAADKEASAMKKAKEDYELLLARQKETVDKELQQAQKREEQLVNQLNQEKQRLQGQESQLHTFYQQQMETILGEKVKQLQAHVTELEVKLKAERQEELERVRSEAMRDQEALRRRLTSDFQEIVEKFALQRSGLEKSLEMARKEADCLREQLRQAQKINQTSINSSNSQRELWAVAAATVSSNGQTSTVAPANPNSRPVTPSETWSVSSGSSRQSQKMKNKDMSSPILLNNKRPKAKSKGQVTDAPANSLLTLEEKERIVQHFVRQFVQDNPDVATDQNLMAGLSDMAAKLVHQSFRDEATSSFRSVENDLSFEKS